MGFWSILGGGLEALAGGVGEIFAPGNPLSTAAITGGVGTLIGGLNDKPSSVSGTSSLSPSPYIKAGVDALQPASNYYKTALGGDRNALQGLLGPEVSTVLAQYDNAAKTAAEMAPRGGGQNQVLAEAPFKKAAAYGEALSGARRGAAAGSAAIGRDIISAGTSENSFKTSLARLQFEQQQERNKQISGLTGGIGSILANLLAKKKGKGDGISIPTLGDTPAGPFPGDFPGSPNSPTDYTGL